MINNMDYFYWIQILPIPHCSVEPNWCNYTNLRRNVLYHSTNNYTHKPIDSQGAPLIRSWGSVAYSSHQDLMMFSFCGCLTLSHSVSFFLQTFASLQAAVTLCWTSHPDLFYSSSSFFITCICWYLLLAQLCLTSISPSSYSPSPTPRLCSICWKRKQAPAACQWKEWLFIIFLLSDRNSLTPADIPRLAHSQSP